MKSYAPSSPTRAFAAIDNKTGLRELYVLADHREDLGTLYASPYKPADDGHPNRLHGECGNPQTFDLVRLAVGPGVAGTACLRGNAVRLVDYGEVSTMHEIGAAHVAMADDGVTEETERFTPDRVKF